MRLILRTDHLLWRTRGYGWDYFYLTRPRASQWQLSGWHDLFCDVFPSDEKPVSPVGLWGPQGQPPHVAYAAAHVADPSRVDRAGRRVQHFFVYMLDNEAQRVQALGWDDWGYRLREALAPVYEAVYELDRRDLEAPVVFSARLLAEVQGALPATINLGVT